MKPTYPGYWWAHEIGDPLDADIILVFVEPDGSVWYGKVRFEKSDFDWWSESDLRREEARQKFDRERNIERQR